MGKSLNAGLTPVKELFLMIVLLFSTSVKDRNTVSTEELFCDSLFSGTDHLGVTRRVTHFSRRDISNSISRHSANTTPSDKLTSPQCVWGLFWLCTSQLWMVDRAPARGEARACLRVDVRPCMSRDGTVGWSPQKDTLCKSRDEDVPPHESRHVFFFQQMAALGRLEGEDRRHSERRRGTVCGSSLSSSRLYDFCFLFTPYHRPGTQTWQILFLFVSRRWFDTVTASSLEPCWPTVSLLLNVQRYKKKKKSSLWFSLQLCEMASLIPNVLEGCDGFLCLFFFWVFFLIPPCWNQPCAVSNWWFIKTLRWRGALTWQ